jgi:hypothetical protein
VIPHHREKPFQRLSARRALETVETVSTFSSRNTRLKPGVNERAELTT